MIKRLLFIGLLGLTIGLKQTHAGGGESSAQVVLNAAGARASGLGEAFSTGQNDIAALRYNPASLQSLRSGHASFLYNKGLAEDAKSQFMIGSPLKKNSIGFAVDHYDGGDFPYRVNGLQKTVKAQSDTAVSLAYAWSARKVNLGSTVKYVTSELADQYKANAFALDVGLQWNFSPRAAFGWSAQNMGTSLRYNNRSERLQRTLRQGINYNVFRGKYDTTLFLDAPYLLNERELRLGVGIESHFGPLALRAGYSTGRELNKFAMGAGFLLGRFNFDYTVGLVDQLDTKHMVNLSMRFGSYQQTLIVQKPAPAVYPVWSSTTTFSGPGERTERIGEKPSLSFPERRRRYTLGGKNGRLNLRTPGVYWRKTYLVKPGDSLESIALKIYGRRSAWKKIYITNKHILVNPKEITGKELILP